MDRALVEQARAGDHDAFAALAKQSLGRLYASAGLILRDRDTAEDAVQEALVGAWRGIRALKDADAWDAWLHRLLVRACYRHARFMRRTRVVALSLTPEGATADAAASVADRDQLERGFARLPLDQRTVLVLHHYAGMPLTDIANVLGVPIGTVKSRIHRATQAMRAALEADSRSPVAIGRRYA